MLSLELYGFTAAPYKLSMMPPKPPFSVIFPIHDDRALALHAVRGWQAQRTKATPFEIIAVDSGRPLLAKRVAALLTEGDQLVREKSGNEAKLYNAGGRAASADWLLFTESHVLPCEDTVCTLSQRLKELQCDAAVLGSAHGIRSRFAKVDAELCERESTAMQSLGAWRTVGLRGFLIKKQVFTELGMFNENYFRFAETALAIHLVDSGYQLGALPDVLVQHFDTDSIAELLSAMRKGRLGACRFWAAEPLLAATYFRCAAPSPAQGFIHPARARRHCREISSAFLRGNMRAAWSLLTLGGPTLWMALAGWRGEKCKAWMRAFSAWVRFMGMLHMTHRTEHTQHRQAILEQYYVLRDHCANIGSVDFQAEAVPSHASSLQCSPYSIDAESLTEHGTHFFPPEVWQGEKYCWSAPRDAVMLRLDAAAHRIQLDARPTGGWLARRPKLYLNGVRIPASDVSEADGILCLNLAADRRRVSGKALLSWTCKAFCPAACGLPDKRKLGIALIRIRVEKAHMVAPIQTRGQAA